MIVQVSYERVFNLGNYENMRVSATASVDESGYALAYAECRVAVEEQHAQFIAERTAEQERQRAEWDRQAREREAEWKRQREEQELQNADDQEDGDYDDDEDLPL